MAAKHQIIAPEMYSHEEMEVIETHINKYFGKVSTVFHEIVSPDIHVDICVIPPSKKHNYYTLTTMGMGAHKMNVPQELTEEQLDRTELVIALPKDWKLDEQSILDENWYWPIRLLKSLARLPIACSSWLAYSHTIDHEAPYAPCTKLSAAILTEPQCVATQADYATLPNGEEVNFYQIIPLYREEMEYKINHGLEAFLTKMEDISFVVDNNRRSCID